jgi:hypothetical protein
MDKDNFLEQLHGAIKESKNNKVLWNVEYNDFLEHQLLIKRIGSNEGFIMFTENRAILCLSSMPNLRICILSNRSYVRKDFEELCFKEIKIIGTGKRELLGIFRQFIVDIKDNSIKIIFMTILFFLFFNLGNNNLEGLLKLCENLLNVMGIFLGMAFVFIGFMYSDKEKAIDTFCRGNGDKYYMIDKYIINLSITILTLLILVLVVGSIEPKNLPHSLVKIQEQNNFLDVIISYKTQYGICIFLSWLSISSLIICFSSLVDYYLAHMRNQFFIDAVDKKAEEINDKNKYT